MTQNDVMVNGIDNSSGLPALTPPTNVLGMSPDPTLTCEQQEILQKAMLFLNRRLAGERCCPFRELLQAPGGTGKSFVARAIQRRAGANILIVAPTGIAAAALNGSTVQSALALQREGKQISQKKLAELIVKYDRTLLMVCDEVSMLGANTITAVDDRMQQIFGNKESFGGCGVLWMGDFSQLPPVKDTSLAAALVHSAVGFPKKSTNLANQQSAANLFSSVHKSVLTVQKRSSGDKRLAELCALLRRPGPIGLEVITFLQSRVLTQAKVRADPSWSWAPILVTMNAERHALNWVQLCRFARLKGVPVFRWRRSFGLNPKYEFHPDFLEKLYVDNQLQLCQAFATGAPCILSGNIDVGESLCTRCTFDSLGYKCPESLEAARLAITAFPRVPIIDVPAPDYVLVRVTKQLIEQGQVNFGVGGKSFLIPVDESTESEAVPIVGGGLTGIVGKTVAALQINIKVDTVDLYFAITDYKAQAQSLDKNRT